MLHINRLLQLGFLPLEALNGNKYYQKGEIILIPYGLGWNLKRVGINTTVYIETEKELSIHLKHEDMEVLPTKEDNIYPYSKENIEALLGAYFEMPIGDIEWLFNLENITLVQLEFVVKKVSTYKYFLDNEFKNSTGSGRTVSNYIQYGLDACYKLGKDVLGSANRKRITQEFRDVIFNK